MKKNNITFSEGNFSIPDEIRKKCDIAYGRIEKGDVRQMKNKKPHKLLKTCIPVAACLAIIVTTVLAFPAMAAEIPAFRSVYEFFTGDDFYANHEEYKNDISEYCQPVDTIEENDNNIFTVKSDDTKFKKGLEVQSVYCDSQYISFTYTFVPETNDFGSSTQIHAKQSVKFNGTELCDHEEAIFYKNEDVYMGMFSADISSYVNLDESNCLEINLSDFYGEDQFTYIYNKERDYYEPKKTDVFDLGYSVSCDVKAVKNLVQTYNVNETQSNVTLNTLYVSPFNTKLDITGLTEKQVVVVYDNNDKRYNRMESDGTKSVFEAPLENATSIKVQVLKTDKDDFPVECEFVIPIEKGYRKEYDNNNSLTWEERKAKTTYLPDPDSEEMQKIRQEMYDEMLSKASYFPVNTKIDMDKNIYGGYTLKIIGSQVYTKNYKDMLNEQGIKALEKHKDWLGDNPALVIVDYEITSNYDGIICFTGLPLYSKDMEFYSIGGPYYMSEKDHEGKDTYKYDFKAGETRTLSFGVLVSKEMLDRGLYAYSCGNSGAMTSNYENIMLLEIEK